MRDGPIATITLDRPEKRNAITAAAVRELERVAAHFRMDLETRVVIVRAEGSHFSVGSDLDEVLAGSYAKLPLQQQRRGAEHGALLMRSLEEIPQPTIAAVQGVATGAATCIASACDFRFGSTDCRMGYGEVRLGINLMWNALPRCVRLVGPARAKRMIMTGALIPAAQLLEWGFLDEVLPPAELTSRTGAFAAELAALPPIAVQMIKRSVDAVSGAFDRAIMHMDADQCLLTMGSHDFQEGLRAFAEKRAPTFTGD
jgi:enoyl-CoA hydratase/carnithine racemase